ncbi:MAG: hypothetical protein ACRCSN_17690, partial [Dermatophilaceae bacterium]
VGLVAGAVIGVAVVVLTIGGDRQREATPTPSVNTVPTVSLGPSVTASPVPPVPNPALAPVIVDARSSGTSVALEWTDPSKGQAQFFVTQVDAEPPRFVAQFPAGTTTGTIEGVDPEAAEVCYVVVAVLPDDNGLSSRRCLDPSP